MPQIEEAQFVRWGSIRPDTVPLAAPGITMVVGPNGSGKSCWLDGLKIIFGIAELSGKRSPATYIHDGGPHGSAAEEAWLRATFANPVQTDGRRYRVFARAGGGCERSEHVTVICRVRGDNRRYLILPGRVAWGERRSVEDDLAALADAWPDRRWLGPQKYDAMLEGCGVTKSLRSVLSLPQGETDRLVKQSPTGLMRGLLELVGRQATLDNFRSARTKHVDATAAHRDAVRNAYSKGLEVDRFAVILKQHRQWKQDDARRNDLKTNLIPAARHFAAVEARDDAVKAITAATRDAANTDSDFRGLTAVHGLLLEAAERAALHNRDAGRRLHELVSRSAGLASDAGAQHQRAKTAWSALAEARLLAGKLSLEEAETLTAVAEQSVAGTLGHVAKLEETARGLDEDSTRIAGGGSLAPLHTRDFQAVLLESGIASYVVADGLAEEGYDGLDDAALAAQAALGDALWGVVVADSDYLAASAIAVAADFTGPIVRDRPGSPSGVLAIHRPEGLGALLTELDAVYAPKIPHVRDVIDGGRHAVTPEGMRHGPVVSRFATAREPLITPDARRRHVDRLLSEARGAREELVASSASLPVLRADLATAYSRLDAARRRQALRSAFRSACWDLVEARAAAAESVVAVERAQIDADRWRDEVSEINSLIERFIAEIERVDARQSSAEKEMKSLRGRRREAELTLADAPLPFGFDPSRIVDLEDERILAAELGRLEAAIDDVTRYPLEVRDPVVEDQYVREVKRLEEARSLIEGREAELDEVSRIMKKAREQYDEHIRALVRELKAGFGEICALAGIEGDILLRPGDVPDEYGVDVRVSHKPGERPRSYQDTVHSGGQNAKIAILLLLAAMSLGRNADLLVVDEHQAHLDGTNSDQINAIMRKLSDRVQFVLSAPTAGRADDDRSDVCDLQIAFLPRLPGESWSPPVRLISRLDADSLERRFRATQTAIDDEDEETTP